MFRGFRAAPAARGRVDYQFQWLLRRPIRAVFDARRGVLSFPALLPGVPARSAMVNSLDALVRSRTARTQPAHKRLDGRRARLSTVVRHGHWSLAVTVRGANHQYAVRRALNLINELFLLLQDTWPDYLIEQFGLSAE